MFLTIHGNGATARAAIAGRGTAQYPKLLQVTLLSSLDQQDLRDLFGAEAPLLEDYVQFRARKAIEAKCDGLIASGTTIKSLRDMFGKDPIIVSPGIRPSGSQLDDHKRSATPREAILFGSDYLVVGCPIHAAVNPVAATKHILLEMDDALAELEA